MWYPHNSLMTNRRDTDKPKETNQTTSAINRRRFVKAMGTTGATIGMGVLATGNASATHNPEYQVENLTPKEKAQVVNEVQSAREPYESPHAAEEAIQTYGKRVFDELDQRGIIPSISSFELNTDELTSFDTYVERREGMGVTGFLYNGSPTAHIYVSRKISDHHITIVVEPQVERSYAIVRESAENHDDVLLIDTSVSTSTSDVTTNSGSTYEITPQVIYAGEYCLFDGSPDDPTGDPCLLQCESYDFYCLVGGNRGRCYIAGRTGCCDQPCPDTGRPCVVGVDCEYCFGGELC